MATATQRYRSDIRVQGRPASTDVVINHRRRRHHAEARQWSVAAKRSPIPPGRCSRPAGDVVKEAIGAFPKVVLAEGEYSVVARNEGKDV